MLNIFGKTPKSEIREFNILKDGEHYASLKFKISTKVRCDVSLHDRKFNHEKIGTGNIEDLISSIFLQTTFNWNVFNFHFSNDDCECNFKDLLQKYDFEVTEHKDVNLM